MSRNRYLSRWPAVAAALALALVAAGPAEAGVYDSSVLADAPTMYWRLGEADGATTAADSSGHGISLNYAGAAILDLEAGIQNETNTSAAGDADMFANLIQTNGVPLPMPGTVELWVRTNLPDGTGGGLFSFYDGISVSRGASVGTDGLVHASVVDTLRPEGGLTMVGPSTKPVTDGFWHYVVVNFATHYIYVDLVQGPLGTNPNLGFRMRAFRPNAAAVAQYPQIHLGGTDGQMDEVAVYPNSLATTRMSAHASAGGIGWDADVAGGEEGAPSGCDERGVFWKGVNSTGTNITAYGALNYITTTKQRVRCGTSPPVASGKRPTFVSGQTVRVKLHEDVMNYYSEWGPVQYFCDPLTRCWGLFFNFKLATGPNDVCFLSFKLDQFLQLQGCSGPTTTVKQMISSCTPTGTHGWKLQHEGSSWVAYFACSTTTPTWLKVFSHPDYGWASGWPDVEGFNQGYVCGARTPTGNCWRREGFMGETHSHFQWLSPSGIWTSVPSARCRIDTSFRWDGRVSVATPPIAVQIFENHRVLDC